MLARSRCAGLLMRAPSSAYGPRRAMADAVKVHKVDEAALMGVPAVARTTAKVEMGVSYAPGVPSPMESVQSAHHAMITARTIAPRRGHRTVCAASHISRCAGIEPIVVDGLVATTGGDPLQGPLQYIKLCPL